MYITAFEIDTRFRGVEVFVFEFSEAASVHGVGAVHAESFNVKIICASSDFFVRSECKTYSAVRDRRIVYKGLGHSHDLGDAGFVVASEQ